MTKQEIRDTRQMGKVITWIKEDRKACTRLYILGLTKPYEELTTEQKIVMRVMKKKYKKQIAVCQEIIQNIPHTGRNLGKRFWRVRIIDANTKLAD